MKTIYRVTLSVVLLILTSCEIPNSGVLMQNEIPESVYTYAINHQILDSNESIIAYYDTTISLSNEESAMITTKNLIYHNNGRTTKMLLDDIILVKHNKETLVGDIITAESKDGSIMKIEIAPLNGGELFLEILRKKTN